MTHETVAWLSCLYGFCLTGWVAAAESSKACSCQVRSLCSLFLEFSPSHISMSRWKQKLTCCCATLQQVTEQPGPAAFLRVKLSHVTSHKAKHHHLEASHICREMVLCGPILQL